MLCNEGNDESGIQCLPYGLTSIIKRTGVTGHRESSQLFANIIKAEKFFTFKPTAAQMCLSLELALHKWSIFGVCSVGANSTANTDFADNI